jgi:hypothetical protein
MIVVIMSHVAVTRDLVEQVLSYRTLRTFVGFKNIRFTLSLEIIARRVTTAITRMSRSPPFFAQNLFYTWFFFSRLFFYTWLISLCLRSKCNTQLNLIGRLVFTLIGIHIY